jgi:hypothetical protein
MELSNIRKSISEMTDDEVRAELLAIRTNRRISKRPPQVERKSTVKAEVSTSSLLNNVNAEQAAMLLALLNKTKG